MPRPKTKKAACVKTSSSRKSKSARSGPACESAPKASKPSRASHADKHLDEDTIIFFGANPFRKGSKRATNYEQYKGSSTVREALMAGASPDELLDGRLRGSIKLGHKVTLETTASSSSTNSEVEELKRKLAAEEAKTALLTDMLTKEREAKDRVVAEKALLQCQLDTCQQNESTTEKARLLVAEQEVSTYRQHVTRLETALTNERQHRDAARQQEAIRTDAIIKAKDDDIRRLSEDLRLETQDKSAYLTMAKMLMRSSAHSNNVIQLSPTSPLAGIPDAIGSNDLEEEE